MTKVINLADNADVNTLFKDLDKLQTLFETTEFRKFIGDKCIETLRDISNEELSGINENDVAYSELIKYKMSHQYEVGDDYVLVFNDAMADLSHLSPDTLANYPDGLSIALLIEYGMGLPGTSDDEDDWQTKVNPNRDYTKQWSYIRNSALYHSSGMEGKMIFDKLEKEVDKNIGDWIDEYMSINDID
jgi:hypothetical protein